LSLAGQTLGQGMRILAAFQGLDFDPEDGAFVRKGG
jgi:hypothetical protein